MTRRLWLHIGSHKTGTTTLQRTSRVNQALLDARGLSLVWGPKLANIHEYLGAADRHSLCPQGFVVTAPDALSRSLAAAARDTVLASSENLSFFFTQEAVDALAALVKPHFDEVKILVYLRRQDRHAVSHHQEGAKPDRAAEWSLWGHGLRALPEPDAGQRLYLDYDRRIGLWERAFGSENLVVRVFERPLLRQHDIVSDVLGVIGIADHGLTRLPDSNLSMGRLRAKVGHILNADGLADDRTKDRIINALPDDATMKPAHAEAEHFLSTFLEGNRRLNARLKITPQPDLFSTDFSDYPDLGTDLLDGAATDAALQAIVRVLEGLAQPTGGLSADDLRDAALAVEPGNPALALRLIQAARTLRPNGPTIQRILTRLESKLGQD